MSLQGHVGMSHLILCPSPFGEIISPLHQRAGGGEVGPKTERPLPAQGGLAALIMHCVPTQTFGRNSGLVTFNQVWPGIPLSLSGREEKEKS